MKPVNINLPNIFNQGDNIFLKIKMMHTHRLDGPLIFWEGWFAIPQFTSHGRFQTISKQAYFWYNVRILSVHLFWIGSSPSEHQKSIKLYISTSWALTNTSALSTNPLNNSTHVTHSRQNSIFPFPWPCKERAINCCHSKSKSKRNFFVFWPRNEGNNIKPLKP